MSVAVYNHYKRVITNTMDEIEIDKSNMLMIGRPVPEKHIWCGRLPDS